jgi:YegS/Rv2252/BmrU family lipid kinase
MKTVAFILHGKLASHKELKMQLNLACSRVGFGCSFAFTERYQHAILLSKNAAKNGANVVVSVGGDGMLNEVINGVIEAGNAEVRVGVLPMGSGNDFAKTIGATADKATLLEWIKTDSHQTIDLGLAEFVSPTGETTQRYYNNITDVGMGGDIAEKLYASKRWFGPFLTYQYYIISTLLGYKSLPIEVTADGKTNQFRVMNFCVANGKYFGNGLGVAPNAIPTDGFLNTVSIGDVSLLDYLKNLPNIQKCKPLNHPEVNYSTAKTVEINCSERPIPIDMDGEFVGFTPLKISVVPQKLKFITGAR